MTRLTLHAPFAAWVSRLAEAPDEAFAAGMLGDGLLLDPLEGTVRAPFDGEVVSVAPSRHSVTLRHESGAEILIHLGIDTVSLGGRGFQQLASPGDLVRTGDELLKFDIDFVARNARSLTSPLIVLGDSIDIEDRVIDQVARAGEPLATLNIREPQSPIEPKPAGTMITRTLVVPLANGLHARPSARIVSALAPFACDLAIRGANQERANARSVTALLKLNVRAGDTVVIEGQGIDAVDAVSAVASLILSGMGETGDEHRISPVEVQSPQALSGPVSGVRASAGGAMGVAVQWKVQDLPLPEAGSLDDELTAFDKAVAALAARLQSGTFRNELAATHLAILQDPEMHLAVRDRLMSGSGAAAAWRAVTRSEILALEASGNPLLRERAADLLDVERQLIGLLLDCIEAPLDVPDNAILIADEILPSAFSVLDLGKVVGIVTANGGPTSHSAIMAAARRIPMIVGCGDRLFQIEDGLRLLIEHEEPLLHVDPDDVLIDAFVERHRHIRQSEEQALDAAMADCVTADGKRIEVYANCGSPEDAELAAAHGAEGCGLLRSEFLFLDRDEPPSVSEQTATYGHIARNLVGKPLIVRTLDAGSDKPVGYLHQPREENPALGRRGIRLSLASPDLLVAQFEAIIRGVPAHQRRIMLPMVSDLSELLAAKEMLREVERRLGIEEVTPLGIMVETPAAALQAAMLANEADFLSIGSNDLAQYTLAADRQNAALGDNADALHPAVLRLIRHASDGARLHGRWIGLCGALASEPKASALLIGLGMDELSVIPALVPTIKAAIRRCRTEDARALAEEALRQASAAAVRNLIEEHWHATIV